MEGEDKPLIASVHTELGSGPWRALIEDDHWRVKNIETGEYFPWRPLEGAEYTRWGAVGTHGESSELVHALSHLAAALGEIQRLRG